MGFLNLELLERLHLRAKLPNLIKKQVRKNKSVIFGGQSLNAQLHPALFRPSPDFDVFSRTPERSAHQLERNLDNRVRGDAFSVKKGMFKNTYKVIDNRTGRNVADFVSPTGQRLTTKNINGISHSTLSFEERKRREILRDKASEFRFAKAREDLKRIRAHRLLTRR